MEGWLRNSPASGCGDMITSQSGSLAFISEEISEWLHLHHFGDFLSLTIPDACERLWLVPEHCDRELAKELRYFFLVFFRTGKCFVRMRQMGVLYLFLLVFPECGNGKEWHCLKERCVAIVNSRSGKILLSTCQPFVRRTIITALNSCIGGMAISCRYDLNRIVWRMPLTVPENWPFAKIELVRYALLVLDESLKTIDVSQRKGDRWTNLQQQLSSVAPKKVLKMLGVKVWFQDQTFTTYKIFEDHLESRPGDADRNIFEAFLALLAVEVIDHE